MAQIVSLLAGKNRNYDHQITAIHKALINPWVISGLAVTAGQVAVGEAFIECTRSNREKIMVHFANTSTLNIDTSGNKKIFIEVKQENIDNGIINAEDGSNIAEIKSGANYPTKNFIPLASVTGGVIADERKYIGKKIPDIRGQNRKPKDYNSKTFYWPEFIQGSTLGITGANWVNLHTYCSYNSNEPQYTTQLAIVSQWSPWIWIRKARDADNWNNWEKIYPVSATALDVSGLEVASTSPSNSAELIIRDGNSNKKITLDALRKLMWKADLSGESSMINYSAWLSTSYNDNGSDRATRYAVPNGAIVTFGFIPTQGYNGAVVHLRYSDNNTTSTSPWQSIAQSPQGGIATKIVPPWFVYASAYVTTAGSGNGRFFISISHL